MSDTRSRLSGSMAAAVVVLLVSLTAGSPAESQEDESPRRVETLTIALNGFENNMTPFTHTFLALPNTHDLVNLIYDTLFWSQATDDPEPWLAESAEPSEDYRMWTVTVRRGVRWHDGTPFTAEDVAFTFDYYERMRQFSGRYAHHVFDVPQFERSEVVDEQTVRLFFAAPAAAFRIMPGADLPILPKHVWEEVTEPQKQTDDLPVGTGPYRLTEIVPDQQYRFNANPDYFKGAPLVDELRMPIVREPSAAFASLRTGQVDMVARNVPPELIDEFEGLEGVRVVEGTKMESVQLYFNARKDPLTDPNLRKAIDLAIDKQALVDTVLSGHGRPGRSTFIHPDSPWAHPDGETEHSLERARQLLEDAGYTDGDGDGIRETPDGAALSFSVLVSSFEPQQIRASQLAAEQVRDTGIRLNVEALDPATLRQRRQAPEGGIPDYDAYVSGLETHAHADPDGLYYFFHSPGDKGFGGVITGYSNETLDRLSERATITTDIEDRKTLAHEMQEILAEEAPVVVYFYPDGVYAYREASFDGWITEPGHGIFTKRSFLPGYQRAASDVEEVLVGDGGTSPILWWALAGLAVIAVGAALLVRRRRSGELFEE